VVSSLSLHHWADAHASFREVHRVLKPGGQFIFLDLRRDSRRFFYLALRLGQAFMAPSALRRSNGAVGSFWASYTLSEIKNILYQGPFQEWHQKPQLGWVLIWGRKTL
jgi:SAM-dependent methyltransferase